MTRPSIRTAIVVLTAAVACVPWAEVGALSNPQKGRLTTIDLKACTQLEKHRDGGAWRCPGLPGYPVYVAEGDLRQMLSFGEGAERRRSASQTLGPFNTLFSGKTRPTIEWRVALNAKGQEVPYATIVRFHTTREGETGEVLVITKVDSRVSCRLAVIDARANDNPMAMARDWADMHARLKPCAEQPEVLGKSGQGPM